MVTRRLTLLLGAGAVVDAGLPSAWKLTDRLASLSRHLPDDHSAHIENLFRTIQARLAHQRGLAASELDFEDVLGVLFELAGGQLAAAQSLFGQADGVLSDWLDAEALPDAAERLFTLIRRTLDVVPSETTYLDRLADLGRNTRLDIFTTNYDLSLETALARCGVDFADGFEFRRSPLRRPVRWNAEVYDRPRLRFRLFKLHGSVDWAFPGPTRDPAEWGEVDREGHLRRFPSLMKYPDCQNYRFEVPGAKLGLVSAINLGTRKEILYSHSAFAEMFARFSESLSTNDLCVVIGYSFRDRRINELIEEAVTRRRGALKLLIIDPGYLDLFERWRLLGTFTRARVAAVFPSTARTALESGELKQHIRDVLRETAWTIATTWTTENYVHRPGDELNEATTALSGIRGEIDGLLTQQFAAWQRLGWRETRPDGPDVDEAILLLFRRTESLKSKLDVLRAECSFDAPNPPAPADRERARAFALLADFPGYLVRTHTVFHEPSVTNKSPKDRKWHVANSVASAFDDAAFIMRHAAWHLGIDPLVPTAAGARLPGP